MRAPVACLVAVVSTVLVACAGDVVSPSVPADGIDCGMEDNRHNVDGRRCLLEAFLAGTPASFTSRQTSIEGDPIVRFYLTHVGAPVRISHDARLDRFGSGRIEQLVCERLVPFEQWREQHGAGVGNADIVFLEDGCTEEG